MKTKIFADGFEGHVRRSLARAAKMEKGEQLEAEKIVTYAGEADMRECLERGKRLKRKRGKKGGTVSKKQKEAGGKPAPENEKRPRKSFKGSEVTPAYGNEMSMEALEQFGWNHGEALEIKFCDDVYRGMRAHIKERRLSRKRLEAMLGATPDQVTDLWDGNVARTGTERLVSWACKLGLRISVKLTKPKESKRTERRD